jgi:tetratricopeptide (TPR) repeat protein
VLRELADAFALQQAGRLDDAEAAYAKVLAKMPDDPVALINAGALALTRDDLPMALARLTRAVQHVPANAIARNNLGFAQLRSGLLDAALASFERAIAVKHDYAQAHNNRGIALAQLGRRADAIAAFGRALSFDPSLADAAVNLGDAHADAGDADAATRAYDAALAREPARVAARSGHAFATALAGDLAGAQAALEGIVTQHPDDAAAWQTLGAVANWAWDHDRAEAAFSRAAALDPSRDDAQFGIASARLARGRYREGFAAFERRPLGLLGSDERYARFPRWDGRDVHGALLLHGEQGLGDVVQFARFVRRARDRAERVVVLLDEYLAPLAPLLVSCAGVDRVVTDAAGLDGETVAARASILSLPHLLGIDIADLPGPVPYLAPPEDTIAAWNTRFASSMRPRVGLAWSVLARDAHGFVTRHKSIPPAALAPLVRSADATFVSLQPGAAGDPQAFGANASRIADVRAHLTDFGATAALIASLDLVISADTAVAHVAGALGAPVWLLDRFNSCWRWRLAADTSLWYPTMTIFRQTRFGDWSGVVARVVARLPAWWDGRPRAG